MFSRTRWTGFVLALALFAMPVLQAQAQQIWLDIYDQESGRSFSFTDLNYNIRLSGTRTGISLSANPDPDKPAPPSGGLWDQFDAMFTAPVDELLRPALYTDVDCPNFKRGRAAGMAVSIIYPYCAARTEIFGWYAVRQIRFDSQGNLTGLELAFSQRAGSPTGNLLSGVIRYRVGPLSFSLRTGPNSQFGALDQAHFGDTSLFRLEDLGSGRLRYHASVLRGDWFVDIASTAKPLAVGRYTTGSTGSAVELNVRREAPDQTNSIGCSGPGVLNVRSIKRDSAGRVVALRAQFEQYCGAWPQDPATVASSMIRGEIRFRH